MVKLLIDTCVWLDLAKDYQQQALLTALEELIRQDEMAIILPRTVIDEFAGNKARVIEESSRSLSSTMKRVKDAVEKFGDPRKKSMVLHQLNDVDHRLPTLGGAAVGTVARIETIFSRATVTEISDAVKLRAAQRAIDKRAPFHRQRNGIDDAILIEVYADAVAAKDAARARFAFVTHNTKDFSHPNAGNKLHHPDIAACFSRVKSRYFTTLGEALRRVSPAQFADIMIEQEWFEEPRRLGDIVDAIDELCTKVWYNRHQIRRQKIERGQTKIVEKENFPVNDHLRRPIQRDVWEGALRAAAQVEKEYGLKNRKRVAMAHGLGSRAGVMMSSS
jgi:hypothetical protein